MSIDPKTLESFHGKKVILTLIADDGTATEVTGKVEAASESGMAFKETGKRDVDLVMPNQIEDIALAPEKAKSVSQRKLQPIDTAAVKQHLVDRHGLNRSDVNALTDEQAEEFHNGINHDDLGHKHEAKAEADEAA